MRLRLQVRLASCYLAMGKLRMARVWAERAYGPRRSYYIGRRPRKEKIPLNVESDGSVQSALYAEVMLIAARISYANDDVWEAGREIDEARRLQPPHSKIKAETEEMRVKILGRQAVLLHRREQRRKSQDRACWMEDEKSEGEYLQL